MSPHVSTVRECLRKLARGREKVRGAELDVKVAKKTGLSILLVRASFRELKEIGEIDSHSWTRDFSPLGMVSLHLCPPPLQEHCRVWMDALSSSNSLNAEDKESLANLGDVLLGMSRSDMDRLIEGLVQLRVQQSTFAGEPAFNVSAKFLMESSKLIGSLNSNTLKQFGIRPDLFSGSTKYLVVAGPAQPDAVIFVENPHAFELAVNAGLADTVAWAVTFGYGLSKQANDYGNQLSQMVNSGFHNVERLTRFGSPPVISELLNHGTLLFWGDLDIEGLRIYSQLKSKMPSLQLSGIYQPMIERLQSGGGHPYVKAVGKDNQRAWKTDDPLISSLLSLCSTASVDQEIVSVEDMRNLYLSKLDSRLMN